MNSFTKSNFASTNCWGKKPLFMKGAFHFLSSTFAKSNNLDINNNIADVYHVWPTWKEVLKISIEDDAEARFITHVPGEPKSWRMILGPFEEFELDSFSPSSTSSSSINKDDVEELENDPLQEPKQGLTKNQKQKPKQNQSRLENGEKKNKLKIDQSPSSNNEKKFSSRKETDHDEDSKDDMSYYVDDRANEEKYDVVPEVYDDYDKNDKEIDNDSKDVYVDYDLKERVRGSHNIEGDYDVYGIKKEREIDNDSKEVYDDYNLGQESLKGRFEKVNDEDSNDNGTLIDEGEKWTMVVNDVDRFHPSLFDFISENFSFIPQWRRDDGQSTYNCGFNI